ncbi:TPA: hypothetical protein ACIVWY_004111 [Salmonella enterica subsp. enterica serovar Saintpaul]
MGVIIEPFCAAMGDDLWEAGTKARYIVGIPHGPILYEGNLRIAAWWYWLFNCRQAVAFDRRSWVINPNYWITGDTPNENYFKNKES